MASPDTIKSVIKLLDIVMLAVEATPAILAKYNKAKAKIEKMIEEGRNPTQEEWDELVDLTNENSNELQS